MGHKEQYSPRELRLMCIEVIEDLNEKKKYQRTTRAKRRHALTLKFWISVLAIMDSIDAIPVTELAALALKYKKGKEEQNG